MNLLSKINQATVFGAGTRLYAGIRAAIDAAIGEAIDAFAATNGRRIGHGDA